ncbi:MAG: hypothetical protein RL417_666 [Pseudomonadota bacterium]|jgi:membrane protein YdbS with pleckstrin-like domain
MAVYPSASELLKSPPGVDLLVVRRSIRSMLPLCAFFVISLIIAYSITEIYKDTGLFSGVSFLPTLSVRWLAVIPAGFLLEILRRLYDDLYIFRDERILHQDGKLSLKYIIPTVRYSDIRAITVYQDLLGRVLNYGDIDVGTAAQDGAEISFYGVYAPKELARILDEFRNYHRSKDGKVARSNLAVQALTADE